MRALTRRVNLLFQCVAWPSLAIGVEGNGEKKVQVRVIRSDGRRLMSIDGRTRPRQPRDSRIVSDDRRKYDWAFISRRKFEWAGPSLSFGSVEPAPGATDKWLRHNRPDGRKKNEHRNEEEETNQEVNRSGNHGGQLATGRSKVDAEDMKPVDITQVSGAERSVASARLALTRSSVRSGHFAVGSHGSSHHQQHNHNH